MTKNFKEFMESDVIFEEEDFDSIEGNYDHFFTEVGQLIDSLDPENISDETNNAADMLLDDMIDLLLTLNDYDFDAQTEKHFMNIVNILGLDKEVAEGLQVQARKTNGGRKRSQMSKIHGADKLKYLKRLKARRKQYKHDASLRHKVKRQSIRYKKTAGAKQVARKYKQFHH